MFEVHCGLTNESIAYFSSEDKARNFVTGLTQMTSNISMIGLTLLLKPFGEYFEIRPVILDSITASEFFDTVQKRIEDFKNDDDDDENDYE